MWIPSPSPPSNIPEQPTPLNLVGFIGSLGFSNQPTFRDRLGTEQFVRFHPQVPRISKGVDLGFIGHLLLATRSLLFKPHLGSLGESMKNGDGPRRSLGKKTYKSKDYIRKKRWFAKKWKDFGKIRLVALCWSFQPILFWKLEVSRWAFFASWEVYFWYAVVYSCTFRPTGTYPKTIGKYRFFKATGIAAGLLRFLGFLSLMDRWWISLMSETPDLHIYPLVNQWLSKHSHGCFLDFLLGFLTIKMLSFFYGPMLGKMGWVSIGKKHPGGQRSGYLLPVSYRFNRSHRRSKPNYVCIYLPPKTEIPGISVKISILVFEVS